MWTLRNDPGASSFSTILNAHDKEKWDKEDKNKKTYMVTTNSYKEFELHKL